MRIRHTGTFQEAYPIFFMSFHAFSFALESCYFEGTAAFSTFSSRFALRIWAWLAIERWAYGAAVRNNGTGSIPVLCVWVLSSGTKARRTFRTWRVVSTSCTLSCLLAAAAEQDVQQDVFDGDSGGDGVAIATKRE